MKRFGVCPSCHAGGIIDLSVFKQCLLCAVRLMSPSVMGKLFKRKRCTHG